MGCGTLKAHYPLIHSQVFVLSPDNPPLHPSRRLLYLPPGDALNSSVGFSQLTNVLLNLVRWQ